MKQGVVPDELTAPFWEAANDGRLVIQNCGDCDRLQNPPLPACSACGLADGLGWKEMSGRGTIYNYCVVYDTPVDEAPIGGAVEVVFETTANGQKVPEWRVVGG